MDVHLIVQPLGAVHYITYFSEFNGRSTNDLRMIVENGSSHVESVLIHMFVPW